MDLLSREVTRDGETIMLSAKEFELLAHFLRHPNQALSREQLLSAVCGYDFDPGDQRARGVHQLPPAQARRERPPGADRHPPVDGLPAERPLTGAGHPRRPDPRPGRGRPARDRTDRRLRPRRDRPRPRRRCPGWYQGRTVHIHVKVRVSGNVVHTGQLYFRDPTTDAVCRRSPYSSRVACTTRNAKDGIYASGGRQSLVALRRSGGGYVGSKTLVLRS